eukprot:CAMPEP_0172794388 /NCGR_PEP_ID=MMETSP1074-20121228/209954_1 /TAXON_ID=2916 /ORGANISM="Ceratium fusus, Strain PA161109" /LENGTH=406 /DNA_ID=CAMNT_0013631465 /DNA_START=29 /DNA_END=1247 /DNA_ORIENTATION=-
MDTPFLADSSQTINGYHREPTSASGFFVRLGTSGFLLRLGTFVIMALGVVKFGFDAHGTVQPEVTERIVSDQQADTPIGLYGDTAESSGMLEVGNKTFAVMDIASVAAEETTFRKVMALSTKPPYWYVMTCGSKPSRSQKEYADFSIRRYQQLQAITDLHHVYQFATVDSSTFSERATGVVWALSISTNLQTTLSLYSLHRLYQLTWSWLHAHDRTDFTNANDLTKFTQGNLWWMFYLAMYWIYVPISISLATFLSIGLIAYCWLLAFLFGFTCGIGAAMMGAVGALFAITAEPMEPRTGTALKAVYRVLQEDGMYDEQSLEQLQQDHPALKYVASVESFNRTGVPAHGWFSFFTWPMTSLTLPMMCPIICRFYMGTGYIASIEETWSDRHIADYVASLSSLSHTA